MAESSTITREMIEAATAAIPSSSFDRFVDIVRTVDRYDWRNEVGPICLDEFLAEIRAQAMAGCREIRATPDAEEAALTALATGGARG